MDQLPQILLGLFLNTFSQVSYFTDQTDHFLVQMKLIITTISTKKTYKNTLLLAPNMCCNPFDKTTSSKSLANLPLLLKRAWEIKRNQWYEMG